jgi:uncharacterized protein
LAEEPDLRDTALYHSVLAAIAEGNTTRGGIAGYLARPSTDLAHPLGVLEDAGLIAREPDLFRGNRSAYRIGEPLVAFYHAVMRPVWGELERPGRSAGIWRRMRPTFSSKVMGPHFEHLCRDWAHWYAAPETFGGYPARIGSGTINDRSAHVLREIDIGVLGQGESGRSEVLCLGEAKWNTVMTPGHVERLARARDLLRDHPGATAGDRTRLALFSAAGFSDEVRALAARSADIVLVDLSRLYHGE